MVRMGLLGDFALLTDCAQDIKNEQDIVKIPGRHLLLAKGRQMTRNLVMKINAVKHVLIKLSYLLKRN